MVKNGPLQPGMIRQSQGAVHSGNAKAVAKMNKYREPTGPATGRTAAAAPAKLPSVPKASTMGGKTQPAAVDATKPGRGTMQSRRNSGGC